MLIINNEIWTVQFSITELQTMALVQILFLNLYFYLKLYLFIPFGRNLNQIKAEGSLWWNIVQKGKRVSHVNNVRHIDPIILLLSS